MKLIFCYINISRKKLNRRRKERDGYAFQGSVLSRLFPISSLLSAFLVFLLSIFSTSGSIAQQKKLTYDDVVNIAVEQNILINQQKNNLKVSQAEKQQSMANFLPGVEASVRGNRTDGRQWSPEETEMVNTSIDRVSYSIGTDMTVFNGFRNIYRLKQTSQLQKAQEEQVEQSIQDVIFQVSQQFLQVLLDEELLHIAKQDYEVQLELYSQVEAYVNVGTRTKTELLSQEAQLKTSEVNLIKGQNQLRSDKAMLAKTLFFGPEESFEIISPTWNVDSILIAQYNSDSLMLLAKECRPDIKRLEAEENASLQGIRVARSGYFPRMSIYYNYGSDYASNNRRLNPVDSLFHTIAFDDQLLNENYSHQYGFTISIPIFRRLQTRTDVVRSKVAYENSKLSYQDFEMQLFIDVQNAYQDFLSYKESYLAYVTSANASRKAYQKQYEMYRLGQGSIVTLNIENQRNIQAQSEKVQAEYTLLFQQIVLDYYTGILF